MEFSKIEGRCKELKTWILRYAPQCVAEEKHLIEGSQERGYWAHGYLSALLDVLRLFSRDLPSAPYSNRDDYDSRRAA